MLKLSRYVKGKSFANIFGNEQREVFKKLDKLYEFLQKLKFEGKLSQGRNIRVVEEIFGSLKDSYSLHKKADEDIIFPFVERHIPRLSPFLSLLTTERDEFYDIIKECEELIKKIKHVKGQTERMDVVDDLAEKGIYAVVLIRNHIQMEMESVYKVMDKELHTAEKGQLVESLKYLKDKRL